MKLPVVLVLSYLAISKAEGAFRESSQDSLVSTDENSKNFEESIHFLYSRLSPRFLLSPYKTEDEVKALPQQFPHQVYYCFLEEKKCCGGTIVDKSAVLTAASCVKGVSSQRVQVYAGVRDIKVQDTPWQVMQSKRITVHESFNPKTLKNNIALIQFDLPFLFDDAVAQIQYYTNEKTELKGKGSTGSGWGWRGNENSTSTELHYFSNDIISNENCTKELDDKVDGNIVCLNAIPGSGPCHIDLGGPLHFVENNQLYQVGIFSFGSKEGCEKGKPTAYTKVALFANWIKQTLKP